MRILLVEDQPKLARLLQKGLREEGVTADVAATGLDGVWLATEHPYDVVVLDVMLPDVDGLEVCRRIRAVDDRTPILMLTALARAATGSRASAPARTTTWSSRSPSTSSWPGCVRWRGGASYAVPRSAGGRRPRGST